MPLCCVSVTVLPAQRVDALEVMLDGGLESVFTVTITAAQPVVLQAPA